MRRAALEARIGTMLAGALLLEHRVQDAIAAASAVVLEGLGPEIQAVVHHMRAESYLAGGEPDAARRELMLRDEQVQRLRRMLSSPDDLARRASMADLLANPTVR